MSDVEPRPGVDVVVPRLDDDVGGEERAVLVLAHLAQRDPGVRRRGVEQALERRGRLADDDPLWGEVQAQALGQPVEDLPLLDQVGSGGRVDDARGVLREGLREPGDGRAVEVQGLDAGAVMPGISSDSLLAKT